MKYYDTSFLTHENKMCKICVNSWYYVFLIGDLSQEDEEVEKQTEQNHKLKQKIVKF